MTFSRKLAVKAIMDLCQMMQIEGSNEDDVPGQIVEALLLSAGMIASAEGGQSLTCPLGKIEESTNVMLTHLQDEFGAF